MSNAQMAQLVQGLNASEAGAFSQADKERIHKEIIATHGSLGQFSAKLKLRLMLNPLSYQADISMLMQRSASTQWTFQPVVEWLKDNRPERTRMLCIPAGAGTGKSTISAALLTQRETSVHIAAHHFFKYNDQRNLDALAAVRTLAHQLASR